MLQEIPVGVLSSWDCLSHVFDKYLTGCAVNNVGKSHAYPVNFAESEPSELSDIIAINVDATVRVTRIVLPGMVKRCALVPSAHATASH